MLPKMGSKMHMVAKKMREQYIRDVIFPDVKIFLDPMRERQPDDTLEKLYNNMEVAAVIEGRDEFEDVDLVFPHRTPYTLMKTDHGLVRPFTVRHNDQEIMVTLKKIERHAKSRKPVLL
mmetsp:Transcript_1940/g.3355  ORF Transcript_1940/g.3355 Transcript_1940/m.3355 type:complete len:119 (+) Transcript_1940:319-675(+)